MEFEARDREFTDQWRQITGQVQCSICNRILPDTQFYGKGKHAMVDYTKRKLQIICDYCYVGLQQGIEPEEMRKREFIETELRKARSNLYAEKIEYHRPPRRVRAKLSDSHLETEAQEKENGQTDYGPLVDQIVDSIVDSIADRVKRTGRKLWGDLTN